MTRNLFFIACAMFFFSSSHLNSQIIHEFRSFHEMQSEHRVAHRASQKIAGEKIYTTNKKGEKRLVRTSTYDRQGNIVGLTRYNKKGKTAQTGTFTYNDSHKITGFEYHKGEKLTINGTTQYDANNNITLYEWYKNGSKLQNKWTATYNDRNRPLTKEYFNRKGQLQSRWEYAYYEEGQPKSTKSFNKKGKLIHHWNYTCDPMGKEVQKKQDDVCRNTIYDEDGNRVVTYIFKNDKGRVRKTLMKYDTGDHLLEYATFNNKGKQTIRYTNAFNEAGFMVKREHYNNKNEVRSKTVYLYDDDNNLSTISAYRKGQSEPKSTKHYEYSSF